eukprot:7345165-Pyramimonas_sp.AAC.1
MAQPRGRPSNNRKHARAERRPTATKQTVRPACPVPILILVLLLLVFLVLLLLVLLLLLFALLVLLPRLSLGYDGRRS